MNDNVADEKSVTETTPSIGNELDLFCQHIDAIDHVLGPMAVAVHDIARKSAEQLAEFENERCEVKTEGDERTVKIPNAHFREWKRRYQTLEHLHLSRSLLPRSLLVLLVSQYDAYLGRILRTIFIRKPEILATSEKKISFEVLSQFPSIEAAREYMLEKEVEAILRSSHADQFKWMENTFGLPLRKDLKSWPSFIELTERRNLFVHTDGVISSQYLAVCKLNNCIIDDDSKEGQRLNVSGEYFNAAHGCIYEIGVKLGHVLWRKLLPDEREAADDHLISATYELLERGKWNQAIKLLDFACNEFKKFSSEGRQLTLVVNQAQAYKWNGDGQRCKRIMESIDWSAKSDQFRLAHAVLADDWSAAAKMMLSIGKNGAVDPNGYRDWPLFREFRKQQQFLETYERVFDTPFPVRSEVKKKESQNEVPPTATTGQDNISAPEES